MLSGFSARKKVSIFKPMIRTRQKEIRGSIKLKKKEYDFLVSDDLLKRKKQKQKSQ